MRKSMILAAALSLGLSGVAMVGCEEREEHRTGTPTHETTPEERARQEGVTPTPPTPAPTEQPRQEGAAPTPAPTEQPRQEGAAPATRPAQPGAPGQEGQMGQPGQEDQPGQPGQPEQQDQPGDTGQNQ